MQKGEGKLNQQVFQHYLLCTRGRAEATARPWEQRHSYNRRWKGPPRSHAGHPGNGGGDVYLCLGKVSEKGWHCIVRGLLHRKCSVNNGVTGLTEEWGELQPQRSRDWGIRLLRAEAAGLHQKIHAVRKPAEHKGTSARKHSQLLQQFKQEHSLGQGGKTNRAENGLDTGFSGSYLTGSGIREQESQESKIILRFPAW